MEKNRKLMKNLVDISVMVTQSTNFFEIKDKIVDKMLEVIEPTKACINLFYDNNFKNAYLVCSSTLDYIPKMFPKNSRIGTKLDFNESYPEYIHEAVRDKKIIYVENIFEDPKAIDERELAKMEGYSGMLSQMVRCLEWCRRAGSRITMNSMRCGISHRERSLAQT